MRVPHVEKPSSMGRALRMAVLSALLAHSPGILDALDLGGLPVFARRGSDPAAIAAFAAAWPRQVAGWTEFPASPGRRLTRVGLDLPGAGTPISRGAFPQPPEDLTIVIPFLADRALLETPGLALLLPRVGQGWRLWLNGTLLRDELLDDGAGGLAAERSLRGLLIDLDARWLVQGTNFLAFAIRGDPGDPETGLSTAEPFLIDARQLFKQRPHEGLEIMLVGIYAFFGLYHLLVFSFRPRERAWLPFSLGVLLVALFAGSRTPIAADLVRDTAILDAVHLASLFLVLPAFLSFAELNFRGRLAWASILSLSTGVVLAAIIPFFRRSFMQRVWILSASANFTLIIGFVLIPAVLASLKATPGRHRLRAFLASDSSRLLPGALATSVAAGFDIVAVEGGGVMTWTPFAFLLVILGAAGMLADRWTRAQDEHAATASKLELMVKERSERLSASTAARERLAADLERSTRRLEEAEEASARDMLLARELQRGVFPSEPPLVEGWDIAFAWKPAKGVSSDFLDFYVAGDRLRGVLIGDVSGKGVSAGLEAMLARSAFRRRFSAGGGKPLGGLLADIQRDLVMELEGSDEFLTAILLRLDGGRVEYINAAHPDPLYRRAGRGSAQALTPKDPAGFRGPPLGKEGLEKTERRAIRFSPGPDDIVLLFTDRMVEAANTAGERYGLGRLAASLGAAPVSSARETLGSLLAGLETWTEYAPCQDDLTAIVLRRIG